jgi:hypothetical protein
MTAACARLDRAMADGIFFGQDTASIAIAKSICATCPLMEAGADPRPTAEGGSGAVLPGLRC